MPTPAAPVLPAKAAMPAKATSKAKAAAPAGPTMEEQQQAVNAALVSALQEKQAAESALVVAKEDYAFAKRKYDASKPEGFWGSVKRSSASPSKSELNQAEKRLTKATAAVEQAKAAAAALRGDSAMVANISALPPEALVSYPDGAVEAARKDLVAAHAEAERLLTSFNENQLSAQLLGDQQTPLRAKVIEKTARVTELRGIVEQEYQELAAAAAAKMPAPEPAPEATEGVTEAPVAKRVPHVPLAKAGSAALLDQAIADLRSAEKQAGNSAYALDQFSYKARMEAKAFEAANLNLAQAQSTFATAHANWLAAGNAQPEAKAEKTGIFCKLFPFLCR
jgi:hypothetical protein